MREYNKWRKMLMGGIIFAFITMALGEIPIGWAKYPETGNELLNIIMGSGNLSILQMACGALFGGIFIPLQYYGFKAIADIISSEANSLKNEAERDIKQLKELTVAAKELASVIKALEKEELGTEANETKINIVFEENKEKWAT